MEERIKCRRCGAIFAKPKRGYLPTLWWSGIKWKGLPVDSGGIIACESCGFEGPLKEYDVLEQEGA